MSAARGLYLHLPWCLQKCPYCDFNSHALRAALPEESYLDALIADLRAEAERLGEERRVATVFIGGGTPSLFSGVGIARLLEAVGEVVALDRDAEITLEANPGAAEAGRFAAYREAGVNRLSIGVQSFDDRALARLGRVHDSAAATAAVRAARAAGFEAINIDLMFGLPGQVRTAALDDLSRALALAPGHLSWYQLTVEPHTAFDRQRPADLPADEVLADWHAEGLARLADAGLARYEISAFAAEGQRCAHNLNYWRSGDYLGCGAGAHGKHSEPGGVWRYSKQRHPRSYQRAAGGPAADGERRRVAEDERPFECLLNGLRLVDGISIARFEARAGRPLTCLEPALSEQIERGLLRDPTGGRLACTPLGLNYLHSVLAAFLPAGETGGSG